MAATMPTSLPMCTAEQMESPYRRCSPSTSMVNGSPSARRETAAPITTGVYAEQTFKAGTIFYRAEAWAARAPGRFLGAEPVDISNEAEQAYNLDVWRNAREMMRTYRLTEDTTMYFGNVAGGESYQALIPAGIRPSDILEQIGTRALP